MTRATDPMTELARWLTASNHREKLLESVARLNREGIQPNQKMAMDRAHRAYWAKSHRSNGSQAIRDLIKAGFLVDRNVGGSENQLVLGPTVAVLSDWQEEQGFTRLDKYLEEV